LLLLGHDFPFPPRFRADPWLDRSALRALAVSSPPARPPLAPRSLPCRVRLGVVRKPFDRPLLTMPLMYTASAHRSRSGPLASICSRASRCLGLLSPSSHAATYRSAHSA